MKIILASSSPRRIEFMKQLVADFEIKVAELDEKIDMEKSAAENSQSLATEKARAVFEKDSLTLGFDTLGELDGDVFGKPKDKEDAVRLLQKLSGKTHTVVSSFCVKNDKEEIVGSETTQVKFRELTNAEIEKYVAENPVESFAGAYAIQGDAKKFVENVEGEVEVVIGFPLQKIKQILKQLCVEG